jgi:hypothetical protein
MPGFTYDAAILYKDSARRSLRLTSLHLTALSLEGFSNGLGIELGWGFGVLL